MKNIPIVLFLLCLLASCTQDSFTVDPEGADDTSQRTDISFTQASNSYIDNTKAATATPTNIANYGVSCSWYPKDRTYTTAACGSYFFKVIIDAADGKSDYYWPGTDYRLSFFAYYPCDNANVTVVSTQEDLGMPQYRYVIPSDVSEQVDFLTCNVIDHIGLSRTPVPLDFNHKCAEMRFAAYNKTTENITLKSISVVGMKYKGILFNENWVLDDDINNESEHPFLFEPTIEIAPDETKDITGIENHFIVLPQTITQGTTMIVVKTIEEGEEHIYSYNLPQDVTFSEGKSYKYKLGLGHGELVIDPVNITPWQSVTDFEGNFELAE